MVDAISLQCVEKGGAGKDLVAADLIAIVDGTCSFFRTRKQRNGDGIYDQNLLRVAFKAKGGFYGKT